jgi:hypothetical protein
VRSTHREIWAIGIALAFAIAGCASRAERRDDRRDAYLEDVTGWEKLGERTVHGGPRRGDRDVIVVGRDDGMFTRLMLKAEYSGLELYDVNITFGDGSTWSPSTRFVFTKNSRSRVIDLPGGARNVRKVEFLYRNLRGGGRAQMELWGK